MVIYTISIRYLSAINLTQFEVKYNKAVDETSATAAGNYTLTRGASTKTISDATFTLQDDEKTVLVTMTGADAAHTLTNQLEHKLVINGVRSLDKTEKLVDIENKFTISDTTAPTVKSVEVQGLRTIKVVFSEDVKNAATVANYKLDDKALSSFAVGTLSYNQEANSVTIPFAMDLAQGSHKLTVSVGSVIVDYAALKLVQADQTITVAVDSATPAIDKVEIVKDPAGLASGKYAKVTFTKPLAYDGLVDSGNRVTNVTGATNIKIDGVQQNAAIKSGILYLQDNGGGSNYYASGTHMLRINQEGLTTTNTVNDDKYIVDTSSVKLPDNATYSYTVTVDTTAPTVKDVTVSDSSTVTVTFSEEVDPTSAQTKSNYALKDSDGDLVEIATLTHNPNSDGKDVVEIGLSDDLSAGTYTLTMKDVKDIATPANKLVEVTKTFVVEDIVAPTLSSATFDNTDNRTIYVTFSEAIETTALTNKSNYNINGRSLPSLTTITAEQDNKVVKLVLPSNHTFGTLTGLSLAVANMVDLAGNKMSGLYQTKALATITNFTTKAYSTSEYVRVKDARTIELMFTKQLSQLDPASFTVSIGAVPVDVPVLATSSFTNKSTGYSVVTLKLGKDVVSAEGKTDLDANLVVSINTTGDTEALDGAVLAAAKAFPTDGAVADCIAPFIKSVKQVNGTTDADDIKLTFSEPLTIDAGYKYDIAVYDLTDDTDLAVDTDFTVDDTNKATGVLDINVKVAGMDGHILQVSLGNGRYVVDAGANTAETFTKIVRNSADDADALVYERVAPTASVTTTNATTLVLTYSEALYNSGVAIADGADVKSLFTYNGTAANYTSATYNATAKTVTFVITGEDTKTLTVAATVTDKAGNKIISTKDVGTFTAPATWALN